MSSAPLLDFDLIEPIVPSESSQPSPIDHSESSQSSHNLVNTHSMITRSKVGTFKPKVYHSKVTQLSNTTRVDVHKEMMYPYWRKVVQNEPGVLIKNNTLTLCSFSPFRRFIGYKWLFKIKKKLDVTVDRYKARLVAKVRAKIVGVVFSVAITLKQVDANNAFLNGTLTEEIYMDQPLGFEPIYVNGKQTVCSVESSLFLMAYVDDIIIIGSSSKEIDKIVHQLHSRFSIKYMGDLHFFLGIEVHHMSHALYLTQKKYILELLHKARMD
ncbi:Retrovirus-related Pol polyprotein from transposon TNT 1-94 [Gossypium australe]|uniref:Retrovirus-related Pol polyprotein from transposon TNT 1-94 n=1 Tax=Gossypium australe TaxID=47621 RepID=A0A5B6WR38_9ROSI|nr:Retrovirus-related Pol polyprotein from transposon TNT 1-94 [Gossypium australe]